MREASRMPATAQMKPWRVKIQIRTRSTLTPASREASGLPPIASVLRRPNTVRFSTKPNTTNSAIITHTGVGTVRKRLSASE